MEISNKILQDIGFSRFSGNHEIEASFKSLRIYDIQGITLEENLSCEHQSLLQSVGQISFTICSGKTINEIISNLVCNKSFSLDFDPNSSSTYLVILNSSPEYETCNQGYWKEEEGKIITYNCFVDAKKNIDAHDKKYIPKLLTTLTAAFSLPNFPISLKFLSREVFAHTRDQKILIDFSLKMSGEGYSAYRVVPEEILRTIQNLGSINENLYGNVAHFFDLGTQEKDNLKKFLYYYLAIESHIHQTFKNISRPQPTQLSHYISDRFQQSADQFLSRERDPNQQNNEHQNAKSIYSRFMWCIALKWGNIDDNDIQVFNELRKNRDKISHGEKIDENLLPIHKARVLIIKILQNYRPPTL